MAKIKRKIECDSCDFHGTLTYDNEQFCPSDISYCPACGADILEEENEDEDDMDV